MSEQLVNATPAGRLVLEEWEKYAQVLRARYHL